MVTIAHLAGAFVIFAFLTHIGTTLVSLRRLRVPPPRRLPIADGGPPVTIIRPVCGLDAYEEMTLRSTFELDYPRYEILFCCASADDPVVPLVERLIAEHPRITARLLIGDDQPSQNPKLNNVLKGWRNAAHEWVVIADSNVAMPRDYLQRLLSSWRADTGLVSAPPIGERPQGVWAELECAYLNTYQARWQYAADAPGCGLRAGQEHALAPQRPRSPRGASSRWRASRRKMRLRPRWCAGWVCGSASPTGPSRNPWDAGRHSRSGAGRCAGRGCGGPHSPASLRSKSSPGWRRRSRASSTRDGRWRWRARTF